jgi:hypothetical protein
MEDTVAWGVGSVAGELALGAVLIAIRPSRKHRPPTSDSAAPPGLDRRASHEDQIVNLGLMATDFPQYRLSFDRPE